MEKRKLGRSGLEFAPVAFGGNVFGWTADEATSHKLLDAFVDAGFSFVDTADVYSRWAPGNKGGESETVIGSWLKKDPKKRDKVLIATKCGMLPESGALSRAHIKKSVDESLQRLNTDRIDLFQSHKDDKATPQEETLSTYGELIKAGKIRKNTVTVNGKSLYDNCRKTPVDDVKVIWPYKQPMKKSAGFLNLKGNLFDSAIMKTSVISVAFRKRYLSNKKDPNAWEGRAIVFDGPEDYHHRIDDPKLKIDDDCMLFVRGTGPKGYPGAAEVVNMQPPANLIKQGITELPCIGDGRQSGTSGSPSILNASPEAASMGGLAILKTDDRVRIDLNKRTANILISKAEFVRRMKALEKQGGFKSPASQTPWQEIQRGMVDELSNGMVLKPAVKYQRIDKSKGVPRDNH